MSTHRANRVAGLIAAVAATATVVIGAVAASAATPSAGTHPDSVRVGLAAAADAGTGGVHWDGVHWD